jgi:hypothetical protein
MCLAKTLNLLLMAASVEGSLLAGAVLKYMAVLEAAVEAAALRVAVEAAIVGAVVVPGLAHNKAVVVAVISLVQIMLQPLVLVQVLAQ